MSSEEVDTASRWVAPDTFILESLPTYSADKATTRLQSTPSRLHNVATLSRTLHNGHPISRRTPMLLHCSAAEPASMHGLSFFSTNPAILTSLQDECFLTGGCYGDQCPCPPNLKGWCLTPGGTKGPDSWFNRWGKCIVSACPDDGDITSKSFLLHVLGKAGLTRADLMLLFMAQCEGTLGGPLTNDTVATPLNDWIPRTPMPTTSLGVATETATATGTTEVESGSEATVLDDGALSTPRASSIASSTSASPDNTEPSLNVTAIIGIAIGGVALLALVVGVVTFILRRRRRKALPRAESPPVYKPTDSKDRYEKPELDGQALTYDCAEDDAGMHGAAPVVYAELDGGSPVSAVGELPDGRRSPQSDEIERKYQHLTS